MGHEGFYNFLVATMGNVVSALLMYALQAAWLCQRLIDQDYRQNHGSRLTPILDGKESSKPVEIVTTPSDFVLSKNVHYKLKSSKQNSSKCKRSDGTTRVDPSRSHSSTGENRKRKFGRTNRGEGEEREKGEDVHRQKLYLSHPYLENGKDSLTMQYMSGLDEALGLRRAFSDINLSTSWLEFKEEFCQKNQAIKDADIERTVPVTENDLISSLIYANGYIT